MPEFRFRRWRSCTEDSALALDDSSPHGLMQAIETASFAAYSHVPMGESDHEMTTSDLISRLQMLTRCLSPSLLNLSLWGLCLFQIQNLTWCQAL